MELFGLQNFGISLLGSVFSIFFFFIIILYASERKKTVRRKLIKLEGEKVNNMEGENKCESA
jgi:hypothetical protein